MSTDISPLAQALGRVPTGLYIVSTRELSLFKDLKAFKEFVGKPDAFFNPMMALGAGFLLRAVGRQSVGCAVALGVTGALSLAIGLEALPRTRTPASA